MKVIHIYKDEGVSEEFLPQLIKELSTYSAGFISSQDILHTSWEHKTSHLILPGGRDLPYHAALKGKGNRRIKHFVEQGGTYLGICAGAYYGCKEIEFDKGMELEVLGERELAFFPGIAVGPAYGPGTYYYESEKGARAALISDEMDAFRCYYNGGCYFKDAEAYPEVEILSRYLDIEGKPAAIVAMSIGKGKAILSGVHIETSATSSPLLIEEKMASELLPFELKRLSLWNRILLHCR